MKRDQFIIDPNSSTGDVVISGRDIVSKVNNVPRAGTRRDSSVGIGEIRDGIPGFGMQQDKVDFYMSSYTFNM